MASQVQPTSPPQAQSQKNETAVSVVAQPALSQGKADGTSLPQHAVDYMSVMSVASSAISTTATVAGVAMSSFGLALTILTVFGIISLKRLVTGHCEKALKAYLEGERFKNKVDTAIADAIQAKWANVVVLHSTGGSPENDGTVGPTPPRGI